MSLVFDQVSFRYPGTTQGIQNLSLSVNPGELVAVIGPSGSGKSTLLKLVAGLSVGHSGRITLHGQDLRGRPVHQRKVGMVFQNYALFPHLSVLDNVAYGLKIRAVKAPERHAKAAALLDAVGMGAFAQRGIAQLSGGQQQRVALARALAIDPQALLLDEPLAALDAGIRAHLRDQIREIQQRFEATTLFVTHDQEEALAIADRVAVLKDGVLLQIAAPRELYEKPCSTAVARFVGLSNLLPGIVLGQDLVDIGFAKLTAPTAGRAAGARVFALIRPEHVQARPATGSVNLLGGRLGSQRYLGAVSRFDFFVPGAPQPLLGESRETPQAAICLPPEHIRLLDE